MNSRESEQILLAIDGLSANIETLRSLIKSMVDELPAITDCRHEEMQERQTMQGTYRFCPSCGWES